MKKLILPCLVVCAVGAGTFWFKYVDWVTLPRARQLMSDQMNDPSSTQFRNDKFVKSGWHCGEINGKNGMGGYAGFKRFISSGQNGIVYIEGHGQLGKPSFEETMALLKKETTILETSNKLRQQNPNLKAPARADQQRQAAEEVFEDHWKEICA